MKYFSSDVHFSDPATLINDNRPFKSCEDFDKYIINLWNKQTTKRDTIYVIGDFVDCMESTILSGKSLSNLYKN